MTPPLPGARLFPTLVTERTHPQSNPALARHKNTPRRALGRDGSNPRELVGIAVDRFCLWRADRAGRRLLFWRALRERLLRRVECR